MFVQVYKERWCGLSHVKLSTSMPPCRAILNPNPPAFRVRAAPRSWKGALAGGRHGTIHPCKFQLNYGTRHTNKCSEGLVEETVDHVQRGQDKPKNPDESRAS